MKLIDANALKHEIAKAMPSRTEVFLVVDGMPDAIVRCKDCEWSKPEKVFKNVPTSKDMVRWCELITRYVDDDWFCADGERRGNE